MTAPEPSASVRLDVWLWAARFFKTRGLAKEAIGGGRVNVGGAVGKPARPVRVGDRLAITRGQERFVVDVLALAERRGPAVEARRLYAETPESRAAREAAAEQRRLQGHAAPAGRPDKRARRLIRALGDLDAL